MYKNLLFIAILLTIIPIVSGCQKKELADEKLPQLDEIKPGEQVAIMTTSKGDITLRFFPEYAPKAVENFITHAKAGYYDGVTFHRVINDFMIQGGDPEGTGRGGESIWNSPFENEVSNHLFHIRGALSMANAGNTNSNGSQFFIVQSKNANADSLVGKPKQISDYYTKNGGTPQLDMGYSVFGQVVEGMDIVDEIASVPVDSNDKPIDDVKIISIKLDKFKE